MPLAALPFPEFDPVLIEIGPFAIRWYALAYLAGLVIGWRYMVAKSREPGAALDEEAVDDLLVWITIGIILGGRLGYVVAYNPGHFVDHPADVVKVWQGGMAFHGGLLGVVVALLWFARRRGKPMLAIADMVAPIVPLGLFFGRIANFINGELFGRASDVPWAMVFPHGGPAPRHPSQLYEAALEGAVLFGLLWWLSRRPAVRARQGLLAGLFCAGYAIARLAVELFREPDAQLGFLFAGATMGQLLSLPLLLVGLILIAWSRPARGQAS